MQASQRCTACCCGHSTNSLFRNHATVQLACRTNTNVRGGSSAGCAGVSCQATAHRVQAGCQLRRHGCGAVVEADDASVPRLRGPQKLHHHAVLVLQVRHLRQLQMPGGEAEKGREAGWRRRRARRASWAAARAIDVVRLTVGTVSQARLREPGKWRGEVAQRGEATERHALEPKVQ